MSTDNKIINLDAETIKAIKRHKEEAEAASLAFKMAARWQTTTSRQMWNEIDKRYPELEVNQSNWELSEDYTKLVKLD